MRGGGITRVIIISLFATLACAGIIKAATTIGTNISTGGTLDVIGASTLTGNTNIAGSLTSSGANIFYGAASIGGALTATSTLNVTGLTTLSNASTTQLSISSNAYLATTTLSGSLNLSNNIISNIGAAGTDFTSSGGLTLADLLTVSNGGIDMNMKENKGIVTFIFDDGYQTDYTVMLPVFQAKGVPATSCIVTNTIGESGKLTWDNVRSLKTAGWEICGHTKSHTTLTYLTEAQLEDELGDSKAVIEAQGITGVNFLSIPSDKFNSYVKKIASKYYQGMLAGSNTFTESSSSINNVQTDFYEVVGYNIDNYTQGQMETQITNTINNRRWIIYYAHQTDSSDATLIGNLIDYAVTNGATVTTVTDAMNLLPRIQFSGGFIGNGGARLSNVNIRGWYPGMYSKVVFTGSGTNDLTLKDSNIFRSTSKKDYIVEIDGTGSPNTFKWSSNGGSSYTTGVAITGSLQTLDSNVQIHFSVTTGHTSGDRWTWSAFPQPTSTLSVGESGNVNNYTMTVEANSSGNALYISSPTGAGALIGVETGLDIRTGSGGDIYLDSASNYTRIKSVTSAPADTDCNASNELGRMVILSNYGATTWELWLCTQTGASTYAWKKATLN